MPNMKHFQSNVVMWKKYFIILKMEMSSSLANHFRFIILVLRSKTFLFLLLFFFVFSREDSEDLSKIKKNLSRGVSISSYISFCTEALKGQITVKQVAKQSVGGSEFRKIKKAHFSTEI